MAGHGVFTDVVGIASTIRLTFILPTLFVFNFTFGQIDQQSIVKRYDRFKGNEFTSIPLTTFYLVTNSTVKRQWNGWVSSQALENKEKTKVLILEVLDGELTNDLQIVFEISPTNEKIEVIVDTLRSTLRLINHYAVKSISPEKHSKKYLRKVYESSHLGGRLTIDFGDLVTINGAIEIISKRPATRQIIEFRNYKIKETQIKELFDIEEANN